MSCRHEKRYANHALGKTFYVCPSCKEEVTKDGRSIKEEQARYEAKDIELNCKVKDKELDDLYDFIYNSPQVGAWGDDDGVPFMKTTKELVDSTFIGLDFDSYDQLVEYYTKCRGV